jgi:NADPH:quinone reductase-like Zn-dependent oxidoreductase|eukprot:COSAG02_NODE_5650_length_4150_cov_1.949148_5_plen_71_part_00
MLQKTAEHVATLSASPTASATASSMALSGKLALVTGASSGIGLAIAKMFVKEGTVSRVHRPRIIRTAQPR